MKSDSCEYGKLHVSGTPSNLGLILEHITVFAEFRILSIYLQAADILVFGNVSGFHSRLSNLTKDKFFPRLCNSLTESTSINNNIY
jgi:hypothetical protein